MSRVQAPSVTPNNPPRKVAQNPSIRNSVEPNISGIDRLFPLLGTARDLGGQWLATFGYTLATRKNDSNKTTHQVSNLEHELSKGHGPPCISLVQLGFYVQPRSFSLLTTRPQQVMAGGQQQSLGQTFLTSSLEQYRACKFLTYKYKENGEWN